MPTIEKHPAEIEDINNPETPARCCPDCRYPLPVIGPTPVVHQSYYCGVCESVWRVPGHIPGWWVRQWRLSKSQTIADAVWIIVVLTSPIAALLGITTFLIERGWIENPGYLFLTAAIGCALWMIGLAILGKVYTLLLYAIESVWTGTWRLNNELLITTASAR